MQRRCDDLGRARAAAVDQHYDWQAGRLTAPFGPQLLALTGGGLLVEHDAVAQKLARHLHRRVQVAAGVGSQIEYDTTRALLDERFHCTGRLRASIEAE